MCRQFLFRHGKRHRRTITAPGQPMSCKGYSRERFSAFESAYAELYATSCGKFRLPLIQRAAEAFCVCEDWREGIARIHCHDSGHDLFVPFSCKSFFLCPSCSQKRTLLLGEYLSKDLLLSLPNRQFVWTIPRCLRLFLKYDRSLHANLSRLMFSLLTDSFSEAAGRKITTGMVSSLQTFGEYAAWNPHWLVAGCVCCSPKHPGHSVVLEGGFDRYDNFFFIPIGASDDFVQLWRVKVVEFFANRELINTDFAMKLLGWKHSGFSIESGTHIYDERARDALCQYIVRAPVSLEKLYGTVKPTRCCGTRLARGISRVRTGTFRDWILSHSLLSIFRPRANICCGGMASIPQERAVRGRSVRR